MYELTLKHTGPVQLNVLQVNLGVRSVETIWLCFNVNLHKSRVKSTIHQRLFNWWIMCPFSIFYRLMTFVNLYYIRRVRTEWNKSTIWVTKWYGVCYWNVIRWDKQGVIDCIWWVTALCYYLILIGALHTYSYIDLLINEMSAGMINIFFINHIYIF